ncbi:MAG: hypothetical protein ACRD0S_01395 [Acidimicrobiales bacterium]
MSLLDRAGLPPGPEGGPPLTVDVELLDKATIAAVVGPVRILAERLTVCCEDEDLGRFVAAFLAAFEPADEGRAVLHVVRWREWWVAYENGARARTLKSIAEVARWLVWHLNAIGQTASSRHVLVHAAVASYGSRAVVLPGRSGAGKTTLVTALALAGWSYLSDEIAALDPDDDIVGPYPRPLALEPEAGAIVPGALGRWPSEVPRLVTDLELLLPASLGAGPARPARPGAIVFLEVVPGSPARLEPLGRAEALERLVPHTLNLSVLGPRGFRSLARHVRRCQCRRLVVDGVEGVPELLATLVWSPERSER